MAKSAFILFEGRSGRSRGGLGRDHPGLDRMALRRSRALYHDPMNLVDSLTRRENL